VAYESKEEFLVASAAPEDNTPSGILSESASKKVGDKTIPKGDMPLVGDEASSRIDKFKNDEDKLRRARQERRSEFGVKFVSAAIIGFFAWACIYVGFKEMDKGLIGGIVLICIGAYLARVIWKFLGD